MTVLLSDLQNSLLLNRDQTISLRSEYIPKSCGLHFERSPLKVIKASGSYLYSDLGEEYLDCVNCVAHVGHCHPNVVQAGQKAMKEAPFSSWSHWSQTSFDASEYISHLRTTLPKEFDRFLFTSSTAEANDLAIQIARTYTGGHDVVVVDRSFHGSLSCTNDISPRNHRAPDILPPEWVHVLQCPDLYRGKYRDKDPKAVEKYCADAVKVINDAVDKGRKISCLMCEPIMTTAGMIIPPTKWLKEVYSEIKKHGGVTIADEAQSGLGRPGSCWWSFQMHENLIPDIITIGKPLANGYPLAVVATSNAIASVLNPEHVTQFSIDRVGAAIGLAVIRAIRSQSLLANASNVGSFLILGLRALSEEHLNIGEVRGKGLMIGVELVHRGSRKPAQALAERVCYRLKELYIITANDGPFKNILIITPPMCFTPSDAHRVITNLDKVLKEIETQSNPTASNSSGIPVPNDSVGLGLISLEMLENMDEDEDTIEEPEEKETKDIPNIFELMD